MAHHDITQLGPLTPLVGIWEGEKGHDVAPDDDRGTEINRFRERVSFLPIGAVDNHEQKMFGLRYAKIAHRLGVAEPFHEEVGYWIWEPAQQQVLCCFMIPRGISVIAGGKVAPTARAIKLSAAYGSSTHGICSNAFLDREFRTLKFDMELTLPGPDTLSYEQVTTLQIKGQAQPFLHTDKNLLTKVEAAPGY